MIAQPLATIVRGQTPHHAHGPKTADQVDCYRTDDGGLVAVVAGARPDAAAELARAFDIRVPAIEVHDRLDPITAPDGPSEPDLRTGYQAWISVTTTVDQRRRLAEFTMTETLSTMRHLPGFRAVTVFLGRERPTVSEHVIWESEQHYAAVADTPEFAAHHLRHIAEVATDTTWQRVWPCPCD